MKAAKILSGALLATILSLGTIEQSAAWPVNTRMGATADDWVVNVRSTRGGGGGRAVSRWEP